jgi:hypothetical protein
VRRVVAVKFGLARHKTVISPMIAVYRANFSAAPGNSRRASDLGTHHISEIVLTL